MSRFLTILFVCLYTYVSAQSIEGAWRWQGQNDQNEEILADVIFMNGFQVATWYKKADGDFITTNGGKYWTEEGLLTEVVEFHFDKPESVGDTARLKMEFADENTLVFPEHNSTLTRIDDGKTQVLAGPWLFSGRKVDGEVRNRDISLPRKTMKILSGTRFQWIAYNTATAEFFGTGGGTYTAQDGKYTEHIEFFSRNIDRVGVSLEFNFELIDGRWHHSGNNSRGEPMYEFWSPRSE